MQRGVLPVQRLDPVPVGGSSRPGAAAAVAEINAAVACAKAGVPMDLTGPRHFAH
ncbi:hypothetical protein H7X46_14050 [Pseudonocardia sp. C8]|uniref:hypothetical protein n=1 Tax=Pseudonocardia sp. C8 TaxID=2762759 RepID=UPI00164248CE|nr:hypothetical protein [Pseudonocardia sp. C8]MBC3192185.1 hypothetical protein [Pseudonocardia sp. C8]